MDYDDLQELISPSRLRQFKDVQNLILTPTWGICQLSGGRSAINGSKHPTRIFVNLPDFEGVRNVTLYDDSIGNCATGIWRRALGGDVRPDVFRLNGRELQKDHGLFAVGFVAVEVEAWVEVSKGFV